MNVPALDARLDANRFMVLPEFGVDLGPRTIRFPDVVVDTVGGTRGDLKATAPILIAEVLESIDAVVHIDALKIDLPV